MWICVLRPRVLFSQPTAGTGSPLRLPSLFRPQHSPGTQQSPWKPKLVDQVSSQRRDTAVEGAVTAPSCHWDGWLRQEKRRRTRCTRPARRAPGEAGGHKKGPLHAPKLTGSWRPAQGLQPKAGQPPEVPSNLFQKASQGRATTSLPGTAGRAAGARLLFAPWLTHGDFQSFSNSTTCPMIGKYLHSLVLGLAELLAPCPWGCARTQGLGAIPVATSPLNPNVCADGWTQGWGCCGVTGSGS